MIEDRNSLPPTSTEGQGHTPGPWTLGRTGHVLGPDGLPVAFVCFAGRLANCRAEAEANGHLIPAAPEMLEALEMALELRGCLYEAWFSRPEDGPSAESAAREARAVEDAIRAAIATATGASPSVGGSQS